MSDSSNNKDKEVDLLVLIGVFFKNIKIIILFNLLVIIGVLSYSILSLKIDPSKSFLPNVYSPKTLVMINDGSGSGGLDSIIGNSGMGALAGLAGLSESSAGPTDADLAKKLASTDRFINNLNLEFQLDEIYNTKSAKYPKFQLKLLVSQKLLIKLDEDSGLLEITYTDIDKFLATKIVNKATELLEDEFAVIDRVRNKSQYKVVEEQKKIVEAEISRLQAEIIAFQNKHRILDVSVTSNEIARLLSTLQTQLLQKEVQIESYGRIASIKDPGFVKLTNEKKAIETSINKLESGEVGDYPALEDLPVLSMDLTKLKSALEIQLMGYKAIEQQYQALKLTAGGTGPTFQVIEHAEVPEVKSGPSRGKLCIIVTFVGFVLSLFIAYIKESLINIKNDPDKIKRLKGEL